MSLIKNISVGMSADTDVFTRDTLESARAMGVAADAAERLQQAMGRAGPRNASASGAGPTGGGGGNAGAGNVAAIVATSIVPLSQIGGRISAQLNAVAGTITTLARRIDSAIRFPATKRAIDEVQTALRSRIAAASGVAAESLSRVQRATLALGPAADRAISGYRLFTNVATIFNTLTNRGDVARKSLDQLSRTNFNTPAAGASRLANEFRTVAPSVQRATTAVRGLGVQIGLALGIVGLVYKGTQALVGFFAGGIKGAMNLGETLSKTKEVFGDATDAVVGQANEMARAFGLPKAAMLDAASSIGLIAEGAGKSEKEAAGMANSLAKLAADASSFYNVPLETSLEKIRSGLVGESEPLRQFGVLLSETAVKAEAHRLGLDRGKKTLDESAKVTARASLITKGLQTASGDLARTAGSAANQFRASGGGLQNFAATIGTVLLPAVQEGVGVFNELLATTIEVFEANRPMIEGWAESVKNAIGFAGSVVRNFGDYWIVAKLSATQQISNILAYIEVIPGNLAIIADYIAGNWRELIVDAVGAVGAVFHNLGTNLGNLAFQISEFLSGRGFNFEWTGLLEGFEATAAKLPEMLKPNLVDMSGEIDAVMERIAGRDSAAKVAMDAARKPKLPGEKDAAEEGEKYKGTAAVELGSKEANSAIARFRNQSGDEPAKETAKNTEELVKLQRATAAYLKNAMAGKDPVKLAIAKL